MTLLVGLGNPGSRYLDTRHNVGFEVVDALARRWRVESWREAFQALAARTTAGLEPTLLAKPLTYMNLSGDAVASLVNFYKVDLAHLLVVADDVALPLGRLRARRAGSDGGHNGLKSITERLGTADFARLRVGVGRGDARRELSDHVLGRFTPEEQEHVGAAVLRAADAVELFVSEGIERVMNVFNAAEGQQQDPGSA